MSARSVLPLLAVLTFGCALTPDYERPELDLPQAWLDGSPAGDSVANLPWWDLFGDPRLRELTEITLTENKDLAVALGRIAEQRAQVTATRANQFPFIDLMGGAGRGRSSQQVSPGAATRDSFDFSAGLSFDLDVWRKFDRATEASRADLLATEAAYRDVTISLVASVATTYFSLRDLDRRLAISERTVEGRRESLEIVDARFQRGLEAQLDVNQAEVQLAIAEAAVASFERAVAQTQNALRLLLGRNPGTIERGRGLSEQLLLPEVPAGLPYELLQRRPDVVEAEERLIAETARIGVAEANRYPSFRLTASFGTASTTLSQLGFNEAKAWSLASAVLAPVFNSGKLKALAKAQRAKADQAARRYEATLLTAFREVEDALVGVRTFRAEHGARLRQVEAARKAATLSRARYDGGVVSYLEVLDSDRTLFEAELQESLTQQQALAAVVELYRALGGGWTTP